MLGIGTAGWFQLLSCNLVRRSQKVSWVGGLVRGTELLPTPTQIYGAEVGWDRGGG